MSGGTAKSSTDERQPCETDHCISLRIPSIDIVSQAVYGPGPHEDGGEFENTESN